VKASQSGILLLFQERLAAVGFFAELANHFFNWNGYIKKRYRENKKAPYCSPYKHFAWKLPESLAMWKMCNFKGWRTWCATENSWERPRSLILIGASHSGKIEWTR